MKDTTECAVGVSFEMEERGCPITTAKKSGYFGHVPSFHTQSSNDFHHGAESLGRIDIQLRFKSAGLPSPFYPLSWLRGPSLTRIQIWHLVFTLFSPKLGHKTLNAENSQSSTVIVLLFRLAKAGAFPLLNWWRGSKRRFVFRSVGYKSRGGMVYRPRLKK